MALLQIDKGAFPLFGQRYVIDYQYIENWGEMQDISYDYTETELFVLAIVYMFPSYMNVDSDVRDAGCPMVNSSNVMGSFWWDYTKRTVTYNAGTQWEFDVEIIVSAEAIFVSNGGSQPTGYIVYPPASAVGHLSTRDYYDTRSDFTCTVIDTTDMGKKTEVTGARGLLHTFWNCAQFETRTDPQTGTQYVVWVGDVENSVTRTQPTNYDPVINCDSKTHTVYYCELTLQEVT